MNIANHGPEHLDQLCHKRLLPSFLDLLRSQEAEMIRLALGYIELLLTQSAKVNIQTHAHTYIITMVHIG